jgi:polysaccharide pyruvyl transferase CsaB
MSQHALEIYNNILSDDKNKKIDVMISGYYGFNNSGDDYMLESIIKNLKEKDKNINILVLSKKPKETKKRYGVECINRFNLFLIDNLLNKTKMLVSGGGSLIQDVTSTHSLIYYLYIINLALKKNIKTMLLANGIGPIEKLKNKIKVFKILNKVDIITLRDSESIKELEEIGIYKPKVFLTSDITFSRNDDLDFSKIFDFKEKKYFVACIRDWKLKKINIFIKNIIKFCDYVYINYGLIPVFIVMHTQKDLKIIKKINNQLKVKSLIFKEQDYKKISNLIFNSEFVLSMRFHSIIYAIKNLKPFIAISYDPKIKSILREINMTELSIDINKMDFYNLIKILEKIKDNKLEIVNKLKTNLEVLKSRSVNNIDILFYHLRSNK